MDSEHRAQHGILPVYGQTPQQSMVLVWPADEPFPESFAVETMDGKYKHKYVMEVEDGRTE